MLLPLVIGKFAPLTLFNSKEEVGVEDFQLKEFFLDKAYYKADVG